MHVFQDTNSNHEVISIDKFELDDLNPKLKDWITLGDPDPVTWGDVNSNIQRYQDLWRAPHNLQVLIRPQSYTT